MEFKKIFTIFMILLLPTFAFTACQKEKTSKSVDNTNKVSVSTNQNAAQSSQNTNKENLTQNQNNTNISDDEALIQVLDALESEE